LKPKYIGGLIVHQIRNSGLHSYAKFGKNSLKGEPLSQAWAQASFPQAFDPEITSGMAAKRDDMGG